MTAPSQIAFLVIALCLFAPAIEAQKPLVLAKQGSFFINQEDIATAFPTGAGTPLAEGKETREINGRTHVLEYPIHGDVALIKAHRADRLGNLVYRKTARNFGPVMATAARTVVAQVGEVVEVGRLDPENIVTPGIYVDRLVTI